MGKWIISAFADEHSNDLAGQIAALQSFHISHIELRFLDGRNVADLTPPEAKTVKQQLDAGGIRVSAVGSPLGKINLADDFAAHLEKARQVFETANILQTDQIRMFSFYLHAGKDRSQCRGEVIDKLGAMLDLADRFGVKLCHENEGEIYGESPEQCLDLMETFGGRLGCVFDMGNFAFKGYDPLAGYGLLKEYITYFHIKDALAAGAIVPAGCGEACIGRILHAYRDEYQKDVLLSIEPHLQTFDGLNKLVGVAFENPYQFPTAQAAFAEGVRATKALL